LYRAVSDSRFGQKKNTKKFVADQLKKTNICIIVIGIVEVMSNDTDKLGSLSTFKSLSETHHRWGFFYFNHDKKRPSFFILPI
jgi:hypothetical protein